MRTMFLILFIAAAAILETTLLPLPLTLVVVLSLAVVAESEIPLLAFGGGLIVDFFHQSPLGLSSSLFLLLSVIVVLYRQKIRAMALTYLIPITFLSTLIYRYFRYGNMDLFAAIISTLVSFPVTILVFWFWETVSIKKLKVN